MPKSEAATVEGGVPPVDIAHLWMSLRSFRGHLTRTCKHIEGYANGKIMVSDALNTCNTYSEELTKKFDALTLATDKVAQADHDAADELYDKLEEDSDRCVAMKTLLMEVRFRIEADSSRRPAQSSTDITDSATKGFYVDKTLAPFTLEKSHTPEELCNWKEQFRQ